MYERRHTVAYTAADNHDWLIAAAAAATAAIAIVHHMGKWRTGEERDRHLREGDNTIHIHIVGKWLSENIAVKRKQALSN